MYAWSDVAERTDAVYDAALATPHKDTFERLARYAAFRGPGAHRRLLALGPFYGPILCCIIAVQHWFLFFIQLWRPEDEIEVVRADWDPAEFDKVCCPSCLLATKPVSHGVPRPSRRTSNERS